jgi:hypothetical protein
LVTPVLATALHMPTPMGALVAAVDAQGPSVHTPHRGRFA